MVWWRLPPRRQQVVTPLLFGAMAKARRDADAVLVGAFTKSWQPAVDAVDKSQKGQPVEVVRQKLVAALQEHGAHLADTTIDRLAQQISNRKE